MIVDRSQDRKVFRLITLAKQNSDICRHAVLPAGTCVMVIVVEAGGG